MISSMKALGRVKFPPFTGARIMMMPFFVEDINTVFPTAYRDLVEQMFYLHVERHTGVGYLTIDEAKVKPGETHRRPGLHVDGAGGWGGPAPWASCGMLVAASRIGAVAYLGDFTGDAGEDGRCEHLRKQLGLAVDMEGGMAYACSPFLVHEALPLAAGPRQFLRISLPNKAPWFQGYTPSPYGVLPAGPILPRRAEQMDYRL